MDTEQSINYSLFSEKNIFIDSIFLKPIETNEIITLLAKIKNYNSFNENNLTLLKKISKSIFFLLSIIFNKSLLTSKYSSNFKGCTVIQLFKAGDKLICGNYRPINLSLTLFKIFQKCIKARYKC